jgi:hypothetical protein
MLKWIRTVFPTLRIVLIVRPPCAGASLGVRLGWKTDLAGVFLDQPRPYSRSFETVCWLQKRQSTPLERHVIDWCVETTSPFAQLDHNEVLLTFYERVDSRSWT